MTRQGRRRILPEVAAALLVTSLAACVTPGNNIPEQVLVDVPLQAASWPIPANDAFAWRNGATNGTTLAPLQSARFELGAPLIVRGDGDQPVALDDPKSTAGKEGGYVLNFDNVDIRDVAKAVLNDMLGVGYTIDPAVQGSITLRTAKPLTREAALAAFEEALKLAGVALAPGASGYQLVPLQGAVQRGALGAAGGALQPGYQVRVVPLRYVAASEIQRALEPLVAPGTVVQGDPRASFVMVAGAANEVERAEKVVALFDVDWLRSQSFGLFPLRYSSAKVVSDDLGGVIGKQGPLAGLVQITPIEHLNSILVVSKNISYINEMHTWIERFDRGRDVSKPRLFVYNVQSGRARDLAAVLARVFSQSGGKPGSAPPVDEAVPDTVASMGAPVGAPRAGVFSTASRSGASAGFSDTVASVEAVGAPRPGVFSTASRSDASAGFYSGQSAIPGSGVGGSLSGEAAANGAGTEPNDIRITADEVNNALLITTTPNRYAQVEAALARLDVIPLQILLEASIVEVNVNDTFKYGVQASFEKGAFSAVSSSVAAAALAAHTGGLSAAFLRYDIKATLDILSAFTTLRVISAPKLLVLNNRTASLQVGDQIPIATSSSVSTITPNAPTVNTIQLYDTGIILRVTPRANRNGLVLMELSQEVSASVPTSTSNIDSPTIQQRRVATSVAVADGQTIAIGGLMRDNRTNGSKGIPVLKDIPGVGAAFGVDSDGVDRTELMVFISPHVIRNPAEADAATSELIAKLPLLQGRRDDRAR